MADSASKEVNLRIDEPKKFSDAIEKILEKAVNEGYEINIMLGGPEEFPTHTYHNRDIEMKKFTVYSADYWTRMKMTVAGHVLGDDQKELDVIMNTLREYIEDHAAPRNRNI
jgi:hypothetical protein